MPNCASAKKRVRQAEKRAGRNRVRKERLRKALKQFKATLESGDQAAMQEGLKKVQCAVDNAGDKGIMHKNAVNRKKSRLARAMNKALAEK